MPPPAPDHVPASSQPSSQPQSLTSATTGQDLSKTLLPEAIDSGQLSTGAASALQTDNCCTPQSSKRDLMGLQELKAGRSLDLADYYPDGGWGWAVLGAATLVHLLCSGFHLAYGSLFLAIESKYKISDLSTAWLGSSGMAVSLFIAPVVTIVCRRKSPRLYGVIGGLTCALGCLFLAFSTQPEQLFISHCVVMSVGSGVTMVTANIMVGRYFRRRRELAEMILVAGSGVGAAVMSTLLHELIRLIEWMHGLQCLAGLLVLTIVASALYRSANLYHPRRKVILHLKSQKKSRKDRQAEKPPYLDFSALTMRSVRALILVSAVISTGIHVPFILLIKSAEKTTEDQSRLFLLSVYLGLGYVLGCLGLGYITIRNSQECFISRRHLCQTSAILCGLFTLLLILATDERSHALFAWAFGICCGSYYYSLKTYVYELVKTKLMERAWAFLCASNSFPILFGAPIACYLNTTYGSQKAGYIFAGVSMILGGLLFYVMPIFERHPSNNEVLQKHVTCVYNANITEAAALLDMDLTEGAGLSGKQPLANNGHSLNKNSQLSSSSSSNGNSDGTVRVQLQCFVQHKDKSKQATLAKISEEKVSLRSNGSSGDCCKRTGWDGHGHAQTVYPPSISKPKADCGTQATTLPGNDLDKLNSYLDKSGNYLDKSGRDLGIAVGCDKLETKKSKKNEVRIDLFDPPSQEKESTATVSYDSDLYINLCEAQV